MAGIYLHIPFCKKACHYCDFHFSTSLHNKDKLISALKQEINSRKSYINDETIKTIYFGGGTPSILMVHEIDDLINEIYKNFKVEDNVEITLEANPDDLTLDKLRSLKTTVINRLSIGIQSFFDEDLKWMNRAHQSVQATEAILNAQNNGFHNITIDLIYGYPLLTETKWDYNLEKAINFRIPHISAYALTVEPKTALDNFIKKKTEKPINQQQSVAQFKYIIQKLNLSGYEHYEISNFCLPDKQSKHNTNYWNGSKYLGIGPSAHSFNGYNRQWNVANNTKYIENVFAGCCHIHTEILSHLDIANEYIMTSLRISKGLSLIKIKSLLSPQSYTQFNKQLQSHVLKRNIVIENECALLTLSGKLFADSISSDLFVIE